MKKYINTKTLEYGLTEWDIKTLPEFGNVAFPDPFAPPMGFAEVVSAPPEYDAETHAARELAPIQIDDGRWVQQWVIEPLDAALVRARMWDRIKAIRDDKQDAGGYPVIVAGQTKWFHSDVKSRTQQIGLVMMGTSVPAVSWKTMDGSKVTMTYQLAAAVFQAAAQQDMALFAHAEDLLEQVAVAVDPALINIDSGWPQTFQDWIASHQG